MNREPIKNITVVGLGYVGLVTSLCLASKGYNVLGVDRLAEVVETINQGQTPFYEPKLDNLLKEGFETNRFSASNSYQEAVHKANLTFITVGTPSDSQGAVNLSFIKETAQEIGKNLDNKGHIIIVKSTVVPGTTDSIVLPLLEKHSKLKAGVDFGVCMNPEFLKEGTAVDDFMHPDRTVIGCLDPVSGDILEEFFKPFGGPIFRTNARTAEMIKYANNAFLATKVSFINEIANICRLIEDVDVADVAKGIGMDYRINPHFLSAGCGFGGSCFPKDVKGLISFAKEHQYSPILLEATLQLNEFQAQVMIDMALSVLGSLENKKIAILGLAFKPDTSDMREAASIRIINRLLSQRNIQISVYDPAAMTEAKKIFGSKVTYCPSIEDCLKIADICFVITEWAQFKTLLPSLFKKLMKTPIIIDGRKIYDVKVFSKEATLLQIGYKQGH
jgi:UDPglucose 6-dehydrogenase